MIKAIEVTQVRYKEKKNSLFISSKSVAIWECWSRVIVIGYKTDRGGKLLSDSLHSKVIRFRALVSFTYSRCTPVRDNDVIANGTRH